MVSILVVDDHELIHIGISNFVDGFLNYKIIGHAYTGNEAIEKAISLNPDIIFMDISMPDMSGIDASKIILNNNPLINIIALTQHDDVEYANRIIGIGAKGYLLKNSSKDQFIEAINTVLKGKMYFSQDISEKIILESLQKDSFKSEGEMVHLTSREKEIIKKIAEGKNNHQIADELFISIRTVETHRRNLMQKLKVNSVVGLLKYATSNNLINS